MTSKSGAVKTMATLHQYVGQELGVTDWLLIDQARIDQFGAATSDPDPMHVDPAWASQHSPYGSTIAFGFLTLSMLTYFNHLLVEWNEGLAGHGLNYGFNRVRFLAPVMVGKRIRCRMKLQSSTPRGERETLNVLDVTVEIEGEDKPALVAEWLGMWVRSDSVEVS